MKTILSFIAVLFISISGIAQLPACPIKFPVGEFNAASPFGDKVCPALSNINAAINGLGSDINAKVNEVKRTMATFTTNTLNGAIDNDAVQKFTTAMAGMNDVKRQVLNLITDAECGVPGAYSALQTGFKRAGEDFTNVSGIALKLGDALGKMKPLLSETVKIMEEIKAITGSAQEQTPEMKKQVMILSNTIVEINKNLQELSKIDISKTVTAGQNLITGIVPYLVNCAGCALSLETAVTGLGTAAAGTGGGAATSETGFGAVIGATVAALGGTQTIVGTVASTPTCAYVTANYGKVVGYVSDINEFIETGSKLITALSENADEVVTASKALSEMAKLFTRENTPRVKNIQESLSNIAKTINTTAVMIDQQVMPPLSKFAGDKIKQVSADVKQLKYCYDKMMDAGKLASQTIVDNLQQMAIVATTTVDVKKIVENLSIQLDKASDEAQKAARTQWNNLAGSKDRLVLQLLGSKPTDVGAIAMHLPTIGNKIGEIFNEAGAMATNVANLVTGAVAAGKNALQEQVNNLVNSAKTKYAFIENTTRAYAISVAKAKAEYQALQLARASAATRNANEIRSYFVKLSSLKVAVTLTIN